MSFLWVQFVAFPKSELWFGRLVFVCNVIDLIDRSSVFISFSMVMSCCASFIKISACVT